MAGSSPESPEARRRRHRGARSRVKAGLAALRPDQRVIEIAKRVFIGVYSDGLVHAGNLAYMSLVSLFPFFIVAAWLASVLGRTNDGLASVNGFLLTVPPSVADVLRSPIESVLSARTGSLLWFGGLVGLWTTGSLIETIRDIVRRAYGTTSTRPFWQYRLRSIGIIIVSVLGAMFALSMQFALVAVQQFLEQILPFADFAINIVAASKAVPMLILFGAMQSLFISVTPHEYRGRQYPKWPGALCTTLWWYGTTMMLPVALRSFASYDLTYGSLAGVMITLIFFFLVGLGVVIGAELNAALAETPEEKDGLLSGDERQDLKEGTGA